MTHIDRIVTTDAVLLNPRVPAVTKYIYATRQPWHGDTLPTRPTLDELFPFLDHDDHAAGIRGIWEHGLAFVDRSRCSDGGPIRLRSLAAHGDSTDKANATRHCPTALLGQLEGRGAKAEGILLWYYHGEQKRTGAVQVPDVKAARDLGWNVEKVRGARNRLLDSGLLRQVEKVHGRSGSAIYVIDGALPEAQANLADFDTEMTRTLRTLHIGNATLTVDASTNERYGLEALAHEHPEAAARIAITLASAHPISATQLRASIMDAALDEAITVLSPDGITVLSPDEVTVLSPDGKYSPFCPSSPLDPSLRATRENEETQDEDQGQELSQTDDEGSLTKRGTPSPTSADDSPPEEPTADHARTPRLEEWIDTGLDDVDTYSHLVLKLRSLIGADAARNATWETRLPTTSLTHSCRIVRATIADLPIAA